MANLYRVRDTAQDEFFVLADYETSARVAYQDWVQDPVNEMDSSVRLPVLRVSLVASQEAVGGANWGPWPNLIFGPMS